MSRRPVASPVVVVTVALVTVTLAAVVASCGRGDGSASDGTKDDPDGFSGYQRDPAPSVQDVSLPAVDGTPVSMSASPGGLRIVYFGYLSCPDVCPTTMADLKVALGRLGTADRAKVQVDMATIDPVRDTGPELAEYVTTFIPDGMGLRTEDQSMLRAAVRAFGGDYSVAPGLDGVAEVTHTADVFAVDDTGQIVLTWPFGTSSSDLTSDIRRLLAGERPEASS